MMLRTFPAIGIVLAAFVAPSASHADERRFAVFVGSNIGDHHESVLHHAEDDAIRLAQTFRNLGGFPSDQILLLNGVDASELRDAIIRLNMRVRERQNSVLLVFYSGHADAESLHLAGTHFPLAELKALLVGSPATSRVLVVDACRSGSLVGLKGAIPTLAFSVTATEESSPEGFAVLASSTATESAQESLSLGGSFFTHYLNSGLLGAADANRDGAVTLSELYAFASSETRAATVTSPAGPQTPTFEFRLGGRHDLVLTHLRQHDRRTGTVAFAEAGRYVVQPWTDNVLSVPIAEVAEHQPGGRLALPSGRYRITRRGQRSIAEQDVDVTGGETTVVAAGTMHRVDLARVVRKGDVRRSATGFAVMGGWRTDEIAAARSAPSLQMGSGSTLFAVLRHDRHRYSLEVRCGLEQETVSSRLVRTQNRALSLAAAGLYPIDLRRLSLSFGAEIGWLLVHQSYSLAQDVGYVAPPSESLMLPRWSQGTQLGLLAQLDFPISERFYFRVEGALPYRYFRPTPGLPADEQTRKGIHAHLIAGVGAAF